MPLSPKSITTTAVDVWQGSNDLDSLTFRNAGSAGIIYVKNMQTDQAEVSATDYGIILRAGEGASVTRKNDGEGISYANWRAISDTGGGVSLAILAIYKGRRRR